MLTKSRLCSSSVSFQTLSSLQSSTLSPLSSLLFSLNPNKSSSTKSPIPSNPSSLLSVDPPSPHSSRSRHATLMPSKPLETRRLWLASPSQEEPLLLSKPLRNRYFNNLSASSLLPSLLPSKVSKALSSSLRDQSTDSLICLQTFLPTTSPTLQLPIRSSQDKSRLKSRTPSHQWRARSVETPSLSPKLCKLVLPSSLQVSQRFFLHVEGSQTDTVCSCIQLEMQLSLKSA